MVEIPIDPIRMPTITLSQAEMDDIETMMAAGQLPQDFLERHYAAVESNVFGHDHRKDRNGIPVEQGRGSAGNQVKQSIDAYKKFCRDEPDFAVHLKRMQAELDACNEARAALSARGNRRNGRR